MTDSRNYFFYAIVAFTIVISLMLLWPGYIYWDSHQQLTEAITGKFTDWHPPIMSLIWGKLIWIFGSEGIFLCLNLALCVTSVYIISNWFTGRYKTIAFILLFFNPLFFGHVGIIWKDVALANCVILSCALILNGIIHERDLLRSEKLIILSLLFIASFLRANAPFITSPLIAYVIISQNRPWSSLLIALALIPTLTLVTPILNNRLIGAEKSNAINSLFIFDLGGTSAQARQNLFPGEWSAQEQELIINGCYNPEMWNEYIYGKCPFVYSKVTNKNLSKAWFQIVVEHPFAYFKHRLVHFNAFMRYVGPSTSYFYYFPGIPGIQADIYPPLSGNPIMKFYERVMAKMDRQPWNLPFVWLFISFGLLAASCRNKTHQERAVFFISLGSILYAVGYILIGVASDFRYILPTAYASIACLSALLSKKVLIGNKMTRRAGTIFAATLIVVGFIV